MRKWKQSLLAASLAVLTLINGSIHRNEAYYDNQLRKRQAAYEEENKKTPIDISSPSLPRSFSDKAEYINRLEKMEMDFDLYLPAFLDYIKINEAGFRQLTDSDTERGGTIELEDSSFVLGEQDNSWRTNLMKYLGNFNDGDYNTGFMSSMYLNLFGRRLLGQDAINHADAAIDFLVAIDKYSRMSEEEFGKLEYIEIPAPDGTKYKLPPRRLYEPQVQEALKEYVAVSRKLLDATHGAIRGSFPKGLPDKDGIYSGWHTHPVRILSSPTLEDFQPSPADIAGTFLAGPEVIFAQYDNKLHVYAISRGQVREIYTAQID